MDTITIKNDRLTVEIVTTGAELFSVKNSSGRELLWQGDAAYWDERSPNLFPFVGRLFESRYTYRDKSYDMTLHGFAKTATFSAEKLSDDAAVFTMRDDDETRKIYPFKFEFIVSYYLDENQLSVMYTVKNLEDDTMYYGVGAHPGFNVPLADGLAFEDYYLQFDADKAMKVAMADTALMEGEDTEYTGLADGKLQLEHSLFDRDAIILYDIPRKVSLKSDLDPLAIEVEFPNMKYCAFWHQNRSDAPYICIEPWASLPGRNAIVEDLTTNPTLLRLDAKEEQDFLLTYRFCQ